MQKFYELLPEAGRYSQRRFSDPSLLFHDNYVDRQRDRHQRQLGVLRTLMAMRRALVSTKHVSALYLIEVEFHNHPQVIEAWKPYF